MIRNRVRQLRESGFTLVELLITVVIIGVLIAIAIPLYLHYQQGAYDASAKSDLKTLRLAEREFNVDNPSSFGKASEISPTNGKLAMSNSTIGGVVWANADGFCVFTINTKGKPDDNGIGKRFGYPYVAYFYDSTTAQTSTAGCSDMTNYNAFTGYFDSDGYHSF